MRLFSHSPHSLPDIRLERFAQWLSSQECELFLTVLRSRIAEHAVTVAENTVQNAEGFLAAGKPSNEATDALKSISRYAVCAKVIEEIQAEVGQRLSNQETAIEITKSIDIEL